MFRVLLLDDDALFNRSLERSLRHQMDPQFPLDLCSAQTPEQAFDLVKQATVPFDVFLIDQLLGPGPDGIDVLQELLHMSPLSDSVVFTILGDTDTGIRAKQAGAYRFLHKPFEPQDILVSLRSLYELRQTRRERDGLQTLTEIAEQVQKADSLPVLGQIIVEGALRFNFERARLWLIDPDMAMLRGVAQAGPYIVSAADLLQIPIHGSPYVSAALQSRHLTVFHGAELGASYLLKAYGYPTPIGEWVALPLWIGDRVIGLLMMDNHHQQRSISTVQLRELTLLGQQAAAVIERIERIEAERRRSRVLAEIGKLIANQAANADLDTLLRELYRQISYLMDVRSCMIAFYDHHRRRIDVRFEMIAGERGSRRTIPARTGLMSYVIRHRQPVYLRSTEEIDEFVREHGIRRNTRGRAARSWMGVPLLIEREVIGTIVVQNVEHEDAYTDGDLNLLTSIASQVAGAIKSAHIRQKMAHDAQILTVLQNASEALLGITRQSEEWLWHMALTVCTAGYALRFNRAMLFLLDESQAIYSGRLGIGHLNETAAHMAWEIDEQHQWLTFDTYLERLQSGAIGTCDTPTDQLIRGHILPISTLVKQVIHDGKPLIVPSSRSRRALTPELIRQLGEHEYLIVPLLAGKRPIGIVVLDNAFSKVALEQMPIKYLTTWLAQVGLAYSNLRQLSANEQLLHAINTIFPRITNQTLKETLVQLSEAAQATTSADCVIVYPLLPGSDINLPLYDFQHTVSVGLLHPFDPHASQSLSIANTTLLALQNKATLVVSHIDTDVEIMPQLESMRPFLEQEQITAFITAPIYDVHGSQPDAALFIGYRHSLMLTEIDKRRVTAFARSCSTAIGTAHAHEQEPEMLRRLLAQTLEPGSNLDRVAEMLLWAACEVLHVSREMVGLVLRQWERHGHDDAEPREVRRQYYLRPNGQIGKRTGQDLFTGITGEALKSGKNLNIPDVHIPQWAVLFRKRYVTGDEIPVEERGYIKDEPGTPVRTFETRSELDVLIRQGNTQILGLFNIESPENAAFTEMHESRLRRLATVAGIALGMIYRQQNLEAIQTVTQMVVQAQDLKQTLEEVVRAAQQIAPAVSTITLWYRDPVSWQIIPGPHFGVWHPTYLQPNREADDNILNRVMLTPEPFWVADTMIDQRLSNRFIQREGVRSAAAFSLMVQQKSVGALFFNYRQPYEFTDEERLLFPLLASIAAAAIQDALQLEALNVEKQRIEAALSMTNALGTTNDLDQILRRAMDILHARFEQAHPCVLFYHAGQHILTFAQESLRYYANTNTVPALDVEHGPSIAGKVAHLAIERRQLVVLNIPNVHDDPHYRDNYYEVIPSTHSQLTVSLMSTTGTLLGVLILESDQIEYFDTSDEQLVIGISQVLGVAIERAFQNRELSFQRSVANAAGWFAEIAHDIKREIGTIRGRAQLMRARMPFDVHSLLLPDLTMIDQSAARLASYSRSPQESEPSLINLDDWVRSTVEQIHSQQFDRYQRPVNLKWQLQCGDLQARLSVILLERALRHLIRNAFEAMQHGGTLTLTSQLADYKRIQLLVISDGSDIPIDVREKLFSERTTSKSNDVDGSLHGRGLMFVRWYVEAMGGTIELASRPGESVTFLIMLPIVQPEHTKRILR